MFSLWLQYTHCLQKKSHPSLKKIDFDHQTNSKKMILAIELENQMAGFKGGSADMFF